MQIGNHERQNRRSATSESGVESPHSKLRLWLRDVRPLVVEPIANCQLPGHVPSLQRRTCGRRQATAYGKGKRPAGIRSGPRRVVASVCRGYCFRRLRKTARPPRASRLGVAGSGVKLTLSRSVFSAVAEPPYSALIRPAGYAGQVAAPRATHESSAFGGLHGLRVERSVHSGGGRMDAFGVRARPRRVKPQAVSCFFRFVRLHSGGQGVAGIS